MIICKFEKGNLADPGLRHGTIDAIIHKDDEILLIQRAEHLLEGGKWATPGGFFDRGENLFECVKREVLEETGFDSNVKTFLAIMDIPNRRNDDRDNISFVFEVELLEKFDNHDDEVDGMEWFNIYDKELESKMAFDHFAYVKILQKMKEERLSFPLFASQNEWMKL